MAIGPILFWLHVGLAFAFVLAHGVSVFVSLALRRERDPVRVGALLDVSLTGVKVTSLAVILLLLTGVLAAFVGNYWGRGWIWASIGILVVLWVWMAVRGVGHFDAVREALGKPGFHSRRGKGVAEATASAGAVADTAELEALLASPRPFELTVVGLVGLAAIIWMMMAKPF